MYKKILSMNKKNFVLLFETRKKNVIKGNTNHNIF